jgi:hypothetical protein
MNSAATLALLAALLAPVPAPPAGTVDDDTSVTEVSAYLDARDAFERHCFRCHASSEGGNKKALERLDMTRYPFAGRRAGDAGRAVRRALGAAGAKATMPKDDPQSVVGDDLAVLLKWAEAFDAGRPPPPPKP